MTLLAKRELGRDYGVPHLEALWWADDMDSFTAARDESRWQWTLMLMAPDWLDQEMFGAALFYNPFSTKMSALYSTQVRGHAAITTSRPPRNGGNGQRPKGVRP